MAVQGAQRLLNVATSGLTEITWGPDSAASELSLLESVTEANQNVYHQFKVPVAGWPGPVFYVIHVTAVVSLAISIACSGGVLLYLLVCRAAERKSLWKRSIGERLVVYLAMCDLFMSVIHIIDHAHLLIVHDFAPDILCQIFSFFTQSFTMAQGLVILYTSISAFFMVVLNKRLSLGRYDWRLLVAAFGIPFTLFTIAGVFSYLGPSGPWCATDMSEPYGAAVANALTIAIMVTFFVNFVSYIAVWGKIKQVSRSVSSMDERAAATSRRYERSARIMMLFVAVYIAQWWAYVVYATWTFFGPPHIVIIGAVAFFANQGGLFNFIAYTLVRRVGREKPDNKTMSQSGISNHSSGRTKPHGQEKTQTTTLAQAGDDGTNINTKKLTQDATQI